MKNIDVENKLKSACNGISPDILDTIIADCKEEKGNFVTMKTTKPFKWVKAIAGIAAVFILVAVSVFGITTYKNNNAVAASVLFDVNPSIEIDINANEKVLKVTALNEDSNTIIGDMDFKGSSLEVTVNAIIGSLLRNGYINSTANSILVSVSGNSEYNAKELKAKLIDEINEILSAQKITGSVLTQTVNKNDDTKNFAEENGISIGRAQLISRIAEQNTLYTVEELVNLSINELNLISESGNLKLEDVDSSGTASTAEYIGEDAAKQIILEHANIGESDISYYKCKLDWENGHMVYEIDFDANGYEYEYEINAKTGVVEDFEKEHDDNYEKEKEKVEKKEQNDQTTTSYIGEDAAKQAAFTHAGVNAENVFDYECEIGHEKKTVVYEIEFKCGNIEYDYEINAQTGAVIKYEKEVDDDAKYKKDNDMPTASVISQADAKKIALSHAKLSETDIKDFECELDNENNIQIYDISFKSGSYEYDYEINAQTGAVIKYEKEVDDDAKDKKDNDTPTASIISQADAKKIVLSHAKLSETDIKDFECELEKENNIQVYDISFKSGSYEYDYEINAQTGAVIKFEKEVDDDAQDKKDNDTPTASVISQADAKKIVLSHAKLSETDIKDFECELEKENNIQVYDISFKSGTYEYDYEINAQTGAVIKFEKEVDD